MKMIIAVLVALNCLHAEAQVDITNKEAQSIIDSVQWEKLGKRIKFKLADAKAECMTLSNYDNKVDFDCIINNSNHEVVIGKRDLETIISVTGEKLSPSGITINSERANLLCFMSGKCQLTTTLSSAEEKHRYCYMTSHSRYTGSLLQQTTSKETVIIESVNCKAESSVDFVGNQHTIVTTELKTRGNIATVLDVDTFYSQSSLPGLVDQGTACQAMNKVLNQDQQIAVVERSLSDNETTSIRNTDKGLFEQVTLRFSANVIFNGSKSIDIVKGNFCADFKK